SEGQVLRSAEPHFAGDTALKWTSYTYDLFGRLLTTTDPDNKVGKVFYGSLRTTYINALGQRKIEDVGLQGKPVRVTEAAGTAQQATNQYTYDALGRVLTATDAAGNVRQYTYDLMGNKLTDKDPNQGTWSYVYDSAGRLISQTDAKGQTSQISYDVLGRVVSRQAPDFNSQW
ncbi:hypothetical protein, partial [Halopseudomonas sabulinigri]|uniref:hypothetical protein n=1 Tax=Halopseudomonas sabulinigri TaxID=472181 RepID=UPI00333F7A28